MVELVMAGRAVRRPGSVSVLSVAAVSDPATQRALEQGQDAVQDAQTAIRALRAGVVDIADRIGVVTCLSVADFGASLNGATDDTAAIQLALNAAEGAEAVVYIPSGVVAISDTLYVPNKVVLTGVGRGAEGRLRALASFPNDGRPMVRLGRAADTLVFGCRVERLVLDANSRASVGVFSTAANEGSGARFVVVENFTQYGIHFNGASIITVENVEVYPQSSGATTGIYLQSCAGDNLVKRATIGVSGTLTNGLHVESSQCIAESIHIETCTTGVSLDDSTAVLMGVSGPSVNADVTDLIVEQGNTRYNVGLNLVKGQATRMLTASFGGYTNADPFMPLWVGGDAIIGGATHYPREIVPAQITSNQNDYDPSGLSSAQVVHVSSDAARDITGIVLPNTGRTIKVRNRGAFTITLRHQNAGSAVGNRFNGRGNADVALLAGTTVELFKSAVDGCVEVMNNP
jgi:hypothetical protein